MNFAFADRVKETTSATTTSTITLLGAVFPMRSFSAALPANSVNIPVSVSDSAGNFENGLYTLTNSVTLTRTSILSSSNGGAAVTFPAGSKEVSVTIPSALLTKMTISDTVDYSSVISLSSAGRYYMPPQTVSGLINFTLAPNPVRDALVYLRLTANGNGAHQPNLSAFKQWGGSSDWDNRNGIVNQLQFFYDGYDAWYSVSQQVGALAVDITGPILTSPTGASTGTTTASGSVTTNEATGTLYYWTTVNATETIANVKTNGTTMAISSSGAKAISVTSLTPATVYYHHFVHTDASGNDSTVANSGSFTTNAVDNQAPTLTSPTAANSGTTTANASVTTDEGNGTLFYMISGNSTETATTVKAGSSVAVSSTGVKNVSFSGLTASTNYYVHFLHRDALNNESAVVSSASFQTAAAGDVQAPTLTSPTGTKTNSTSATGTVSTNEANGTLYYLASVNSTETAATIKAASSQAVSTTGVQNVTFSGLTASTTYYAHYVHRDAAGNDSAVSTSTSFTTDAGGGATTARFASLTGINETGSDPNWIYTGATNAAPYSTQTAMSTAGLKSGEDGSMQITLNTRVADAFILGITTSGTAVAFGSLPYAIYCNGNGTQYKYITGGTVTNAPSNIINWANGDLVRLRRSGTSLTAEVYKAGSWVNLITWTGVPTGAYKFELLLNSTTSVGSPVGVNLA